MMPTHRQALLVLVFLGVLVFLNVLPNPFLWEDAALITQNPFMKLSNPLHFFVSAYPLQSPWNINETWYQRYRPVAMLTFWFDHQLWGVRSFGYHLTALLFHILNSWLLFLVAHLLTGRSRLALVAAIFFLIHPMQAESVAYLPNRGDIVAGTGVLLLIWLHLNWRRRDSWNLKWCLAEMAALSAALFSKETVVLAPLLVWAYEWTHRSAIPRPSDRRALWKEAAGFLAVGAVYAIARVIWVPVGEVLSWSGAGWQMPLRIFGQTMTLYACWIFWPWTIRFPVLLNPAFSLWGALLWALAVPSAAIFLWRRFPNPALRFGIAWCFITFFPLSNLLVLASLPFTVHYLYTVSVGFWLVLGLLGSFLFDRFFQKKTLRIGLLSGLLVLGAGWISHTVALNARWGEPELIYWDVVRAGPPLDGVGYCLLGTHYLSLGEFQKAAEMSRMAIERDPNTASQHVNLGIAYQSMGQLNEAEKSYQEAIRINPKNGSAHYNLSVLKLSQNQHADAALHAQRALEIAPYLSQAQRILEAAKTAPTQEATLSSKRFQMVEQQIQSRGIKDERVLQAMLKVPRHEFVPAELRHLAYDDNPLPIGNGQTISQPYIVAFMSELARIQKGARVLEVGTGCGYQAAVLAELTDPAELYTIEIVPGLATQGRANLNKLGYAQVHSRTGDGYQGWPEAAPFNAILVTAAPDHVPQPLLDQLAEGGHLVIPVGPSGVTQTLRVITRKSSSEYETRDIIPVSFVPLTRDPADR